MSSRECEPRQRGAAGGRCGVTRRKKGPGRGEGGGGRRNPNSLRNLTPGKPPPAPIGNGRALTHGFRSALLVRDIGSEIRELMDALSAAAPVREGDGSLPPADLVAVETAARALKRWRHVSAWCDMYGRLDEKGDVRPAAHYELQAEAALQRALDSLGMSPMARSKLGLNIARTAQSLTDALIDGGEAWRRNARRGLAATDDGDEPA